MSTVKIAFSLETTWIRRFLPMNINSKNQKCLVSEWMNPNVIEMSDWNIEI